MLHLQITVINEYMLDIGLHHPMIIDMLDIDYELAQQKLSQEVMIDVLMACPFAVSKTNFNQ